MIDLKFNMGFISNTYICTPNPDNTYICTPNPESTCIIDKIMVQYKVSSFSLSISKSDLHVDKYSCSFNAIIDRLIPIDVKQPPYVNFPGLVVVENKYGFMSSLIQHVPDPSFITNENQHVLSQYIDMMFEKISMDGTNIYMTPPNLNRRICIWPAFHTHDQANILLDLKSPLQ